MPTFTTIDEYLDAQPAATRDILSEIRRRAHALLPTAGEKISYQIPAITLDGRTVVHFAGWKKHVSIYPEPDGDRELTAALAGHSNGKGTLAFPLDQPMPYDLIERVIQALVERSRPRAAG